MIGVQTSRRRTRRREREAAVDESCWGRRVKLNNAAALHQ